MTRTDMHAVESIIRVDSTVSVLPFIDTAAALVDWLEGEDSEGLLSSTLLELIERWLSAHFYAHRDQLYQSKSTGRASASFQGQTAMVLSSTQYGQTAMLLDVTGKLAGLSSDTQKGQKSKAGMIWLGTRYTDNNSERASDQ